MNRRLSLALLAAALLPFAGALAQAASPDAGAVDEAVRELGDDDFRVREKALGRLLEWALEDPGIVRRLPVDSPDPEVRAAMRALSPAALKRERHRRKLLRLVGREMFEERLSPLFQVSAPDCFSAVVEFARQCGNPALKAALAECLVDCFLEGDDGMVSAEAAVALGELGERSAAPALAQALERALKARDVFVGGAAESALVKLGDRSVAPALTKMLESDDIHVRLGALHALGGLGERSAAPAIAGRLEGGEEIERASAAEALCRLFGRPWRPDDGGVPEVLAWWRSRKDGPDPALDR